MATKEQLLSRAVWAIGWACFLLYFWWSFAFCFPSWETFELHDSTVRYKMSPEGQVSSTTLNARGVQDVVMRWLPIVVAALSAIFADAIHSPASKLGTLASQEATAAPSRISSGLILRVIDTMVRMVRRVFGWQLPFRRWWLYWCGGINLTESLVILVWIIAHCVGLWDYIRNYRDRFDAWDALGFAYSVPKSVLWLERISLAFAWLSFLDISMLFLPVSHNSFLTVLTGLPYPALIRYHRWLGHSTMVMIALHGSFFYLYWIANPDLNFAKEFFDFGQHDRINYFAGSIAFFFGSALWVTSLNWIRRQYFEVFYKTHIVGFMGFVFFGFMHYNRVWVVMVPGLALYIVDYILRLVQSQSVTTFTSAHVSPNSQVAVMELQVDEKFSKCPVQDLFLLLPSISRWQWHPFTIMSRQPAGASGAPTTVTVALKSFGNWTKELVQQVESGIPIPVRVNGAIDGVHLSDLRDYDHLVLIAGGIAATPIIALAEGILQAKAERQAAVAGLKNVEVIWVARDAQEFTLLPADVLLECSSSKWISIKLFFTGSHQGHKTLLPPAPISKGLDIPLEKLQKDVTYVKDQHPAPAEVTAAPVQLSPPKSLTAVAASPFFWNTFKPVPPKSFGMLYSMAITIAAFAGAFMALVGSKPMDLEWAQGTTKSYYKYGLVLAIDIVVQTIGLPMVLVVLPAHFIRSRTAQQHSHISLTSSSSSTNSATPDSNTFPVVQLGESNRLTFPEMGLATDIQDGRPDIDKIIKDAAQSCGAAGSVGVFCAGPGALMNATALKIWGLNDSRGQQQPRAHVHFHKFAFEL